MGKSNEKQEKIPYLSPELTPTEFEIYSANLLKLGFERRKFTIVHNGNFKTTAPAGKPDIELFDDSFHIIVEVTKTTKSSSDREFNSIKDHLQKIARENKDKHCYCIYVSPETFKRNMDSFSLFNRDRDEKIFPLNIINFNHLIEYIITHDDRYFKQNDLEKLFEFQLKTTTSDSDILEYINQNIIKDPIIEAEIKQQRKIEQEKNNREIEAIMKKIHNMLRGKYAKNPDEAVKEVSKIVFMKMYEEDKELKDINHENRCTIKRLAEIRKNGEEDPINYVFKKIRKEMKKAEPDAIIFEDNEEVDLDDKTITKVLELMNGKSFVKLGMDIKGRIYELFLGSTMKNTALGQYFTPEEVIKFIVSIAHLKIKDKILDPCCGTGRFLTNAMDCLVDKAEHNPEFDENDIKGIRKKQIYGIDLSKAVFKISRMNMYIHEDGKSNILNENFITSNPKLKGKFSCILTNPPFGDINIVEDLEGIEEYEEQIIKEFPILETKEIEKNEVKEKHLREKNYKGGSLLIQRSNRFLEKDGKLISVIDEGLLNTEEYSELRDFIKEYFFIRAVISLPQYTFKRLAKSQPKTSIIYLIKKQNSLDKQVEPIFFAQASKVGINTRGKPCRNDFDLIIPEFNKFIGEIQKNIEKHDGIFNKKAFDFKKFSGNNKNYWNYQEDSGLMYYILHADDLLERFDFAYNRPDLREKIDELKKNDHYELQELLKDNLTRKGTTPANPKHLKKEIPLLTIKNILKDGRIIYEDSAFISRKYFEEKEKKEGQIKRKDIIGLKDNDILMAITGATIGKSAIFKDENKEVAICGDIAKITPENPDNSVFIKNFLDSEIGKIQVLRAINGSTNFHLSTTDIDKIIIPKIKDQKKITQSLNKTDELIADLKIIIETAYNIQNNKNKLIPNFLKNPESLKEYDNKIKKLEESLKNISELKKDK